MYKLLSTKTGGIIYIPNFLEEPQANEIYNFLISNCKFETKYMNFSGSLVGLPRKIAYFGEKSYSYSGIIHEATKNYPGVLISIQKMIFNNEFVVKNISLKHIEKLNTCLINYYENENDYVHFHSDDEKELGPDNEKNIIVASVSLGEQRTFVIRNKEILQKQLGKENVDNIQLEIELKHGSLLVMYGDFQHKYEHSIKKEKTRKEARINLTFRVIK